MLGQSANGHETVKDERHDDDIDIRRQRPPAAQTGKTWSVYMRTGFKCEEIKKMCVIHCIAPYSCIDVNLHATYKPDREETKNRLVLFGKRRTSV